jgi:hypothetical protein
LWVQRDGRSVKVEVRSDGEGVVSHVGSVLLAQIADRLGLTSALSQGLSCIKQRDRGHDPGRVIRDLVVMLADGGECLADLGALRDQEQLFGTVASNATAFRVIDRIAKDPVLLDQLRAAHQLARTRAWELLGAPQQLTIDTDATLINSHSEKQGAAGNFKGGFGFHPMLAYADQTGEAMAGLLRPGNAGANTAADQIAVLDQALAQIPDEHIELIELTLRADSAGAVHKLADACRQERVWFMVGYELTESVRAAILHVPETAWTGAIDQHDSPRCNGQVVEITDRLDLSSWPQGSRVIVRRERPHPGAQYSFTDHDGHRFQATLTDDPEPDIRILERDHRGRARAENHIRDDKDTGLSKFPFHEFALNEVWLQLVLLAHNLLIWTRRLLLDGTQLALASPKRLRYRLLHTAATITHHARQAVLHLSSNWPWARELTDAFTAMAALPPPAR